MALSLEDTAHIIQLALTPVFLLSGIATLLTVFSNRLARVADKLDRLTELAADTSAKNYAEISRQMAFLRQRSWALDIAVILGALAGANTCAATFTLFVGVLRDASTSSILFFLLGFAIVCTLGALAAYLYEMLLASRGLRAQARQQEKTLNAGKEID
jgi:CHASE3 domain sensor protein